MPQGKWTFRPITNSVHDIIAPNSTYTKSVHNEYVMFPGSQITGVGNFIIGASGFDKQMLCVARAAPTLSAVNKIQKV